MSVGTAVLAATACAGLIVLEPLSTIASDTPSPATLRAALADPFSRDFVEIDRGTPKVLEGPFDAQKYSDYFQLDRKSRDSLVASLNKEGFLAGYARTWYQPGSQIWLAEGILAFRATPGATSAMLASKLRYATSAPFRSFVDTNSIPHSFGVTVHDADGFNWTVVIFTKGNDAVSIVAGSDGNFMSDTALTQAKIEYDQAPASTIAPASRADNRTALAAGVAFGATVITALLLLIYFSRRRSSASVVVTRP